MNTPTQTKAQARAALRRLTAPLALTFGRRLVDRTKQDTITFREFVTVARDLIADLPEQSAIYLAALVALDMHSTDSIFTQPRQPSAN